MSSLGSATSGLIPQAMARVEALRDAAPAGAPVALPDGVRVAPAGGFGQILEGLVDHVGDKQAVSGALTRRVLLGESDQLHHAVIAMQEASVAFSLMVEVRNKLVESYQELMRLQV